MKKLLIWIIVLALVVWGVSALAKSKQTSNENLSATAGGAFDQYGYNDSARMFNGTGSSWCVAGDQAPNCVGIYSPDKLIMKWTADWDRGNDEGWAKPPYAGAWIDNEWNGKGAKGGSGAVWHYKIIWVGPELQTSPYWKQGGYPVWGQFEVIMDQGTDPSLDTGHIWFAKAVPNGFGGRK